MDATAFAVDWIGPLRSPEMSQWGGNWTHFVTCAHVLFPWDYPNFYPHEGVTRFVSQITLGDCKLVVKVPVESGEGSYKHFTSMHSNYHHKNSALDVAITHPEMMFKRYGEMRVMLMEVLGAVRRVRLDCVRRVEVGDFVWIYGMTAHESLFDDETRSEPLMVPTGFKGVVVAAGRGCFFVDTCIDGGSRVEMGMCGSPVMRDGKCVGMVTARMHESTKRPEIANCAMCTFAEDIWKFLRDAEDDMNQRPQSSFEEGPSVFDRRRAEERSRSPEAQAEFEAREREAQRIHSGLGSAVHVPVPKMFFKPEQDVTEESKFAEQLFGPRGGFNEEFQENVLGLDMNETTSAQAPKGLRMPNNGVPQRSGSRPDPAPSHFHILDEKDLPNDPMTGSNPQVADAFGAFAEDMRVAKHIKQMQSDRRHEDFKKNAMGEVDACEEPLPRPRSYDEQGLRDEVRAKSEEAKQGKQPGAVEWEKYFSFDGRLEHREKEREKEGEETEKKKKKRKGVGRAASIEAEERRRAQAKNKRTFSDDSFW